MVDQSSGVETEASSDPSAEEQQKIAERLDSTIGTKIEPPITNPVLSRPVKIAPIDAISTVREKIPTDSSQKSDLKNRFGV